MNKLVKFELKNHENQPDDIATRYFLLIHSPIFLESTYIVIQVYTDQNKMYINPFKVNSKSYWSKLVKFELKIMKETHEDIENGPQVKPISTFLAK